MTRANFVFFSVTFFVDASHVCMCVCVPPAADDISADRARILLNILCSVYHTTLLFFCWFS